jgi:hypothetical protein
MTKPVIEGDPFGTVKDDAKPATPEPREVNLFHSRSDVDSSTLSQHHTLGIKHNQASTGDHVHDGASSRKIGQGMSLSVTGAKGGNVALTNLIAMLKNVIEFTDTTT